MKRRLSVWMFMARWVWVPSRLGLPKPNNSAWVSGSSSDNLISKQLVIKVLRKTKMENMQLHKQRTYTTHNDVSHPHTLKNTATVSKNPMFQFFSVAQQRCWADWCNMQNRPLGSIGHRSLPPEHQSDARDAPFKLAASKTTRVIWRMAS